MNPQQRDEIGQIIRRGMQRVEVSNPHQQWADIGEKRREVHRTAGEQIYQDILEWQARNPERADEQETR